MFCTFDLGQEFRIEEEEFLLFSFCYFLLGKPHPLQPKHNPLRRGKKGERE
jgi:hypothetical protein